MTEPPSAMKPSDRGQFGQAMVGKMAPNAAYGAYNTGGASKFSGQKHMSSGMRASGFGQSTHAESTFNSQLSNMVNVKMNNLKQNM